MHDFNSLIPHKVYQLNQGWNIFLKNTRKVSVMGKKSKTEPQEHRGGVNRRSNTAILWTQRQQGLPCNHSLSQLWGGWVQVICTRRHTETLRLCNGGGWRLLFWNSPKLYMSKPKIYSVYCYYFYFFFTDYSSLWGHSFCNMHSSDTLLGTAC